MHILLELQSEKSDNKPWVLAICLLSNLHIQVLNYYNIYMHFCNLRLEGYKTYLLFFHIFSVVLRDKVISALAAALSGRHEGIIVFHAIILRYLETHISILSPAPCSGATTASLRLCVWESYS